MARTTHSYAKLMVSPRTYEEIREKLEKAGYADQFHRGNGFELIDMTGIAIQAGEDDEQEEEAKSL